MNFAKKISHGFQYEVSFTWQKSFDTSSGSFAGDNFSSAATAATPWWDLSIIKGLSDFNVTRNLSVNWLYQIPTPKSFTGPAGLIAKGWGVEGLLDLSDGAPIWPLAGFNSDPLGQNNAEPMDIPDLAPGCTPKNAVQPGNIQYLKPSCFIYPKAPNMQFALANCNQTPAFGTNGQQGRWHHLALTHSHAPISWATFRVIRSLGRDCLTLTCPLLRTTTSRSSGKTFNIQFRAEFFNIFNRTNFAPPSDNLVAFDPNYGDQPSFGQIDQHTQVPMREIQFGLKIVF